MTGASHDEPAWGEEDTPFSPRFGDSYFSREDGLAEARHVFLSGNDLPARFHGEFRVAELGFGTGLNLLATLTAWRGAGTAGALHYTSFEAFPMRPADMARALAAFPELAPDTRMLLAALEAGPGPHDLQGGLRLTVIEGDARETLPSWDGQADAFYLDGFAPAKNPEMWGEALMAEVARHLVPGGTFASFTAAGDVRRALEQAGLEVERRAGFGRKRHMICGRKPAAAG